MAKAAPQSKCNKLLVAAIDFGTTYSGYAFSFKHEYEKDPTKVCSNNWTAGTRALVSLKTPTTLLLDKNKKFDSFGYEAEDKYSDLALDDLHKDWYYFRRFKMMLFQQIGLKRNIMLQAEGDKTKKVPAQTIFRMSIQYLKDHLLGTLRNRATGIDEDDIQWVLTVPAIWNDAAKQFMREAAEQAGIKGSHLLIALEPEAASMYCMNLPVDRILGVAAGKGAITAFSSHTKYMVVDVGGGTVDITVHEVLPNGALRELHKASGGAWGGTRVDEAFKQLIETIVTSTIMERFCLEHAADYVDMYREFETKKRNIKTDTSGKVTFKVPIALKDLFEEDGDTIKAAIARKKYDGKITWAGDKLRIEADIMKGLFDESCNSIVDHVEKLMKDKECKGVDKMLLVGGFSESPLLQEAIRKTFPRLRLIIPEDAGLAVLKGAVLFGHNPQTIASRVAKNAYGIRVYRDFEEGQHPQSKRHLVGNRVKCKDIFACHVHKGQELKVGEAQNSQRYTPLEDTQTSMVFDIYTSTDDDPHFVTDFGSTYIGQLEVQVPNLQGGRDRGVSCKMIFGGTELMVEATEEKTGKVSQAKFNFLD